jgi:putative cell wall-binding protein
MVFAQGDKKNEAVSRSFPVSNKRGDFSITAKNDVVESGNLADFNIYLKVTGSKTSFKNAKIVLDLPSESYISLEQDLNQLKIDNRIPIYDKANHKLTWSFDELNSGISQKLVLELKTSNGMTPNDSLIKVEGVFSADNLLDDSGNKEEIRESASVKVVSNGKIAMTSKFSTAEGKFLVSPAQGENGVWNFSCSVPKLETGTRFIKEGSKIEVSYTLDEFVHYVDVVNDTLKPKEITTDNNGKTTLKWEFEAADTSAQEAAEKNIFERSFSVKTLFDEDTPQFQSVENNLTTSVQFFDGTVKSSESLAASTTVLTRDPKYPESNGTHWTIAAKGPKDSEGGLSGSENLDITAHDTALLAFGANLTVGPADNATCGPSSYEFYYHIDDHLNMDRFYSGDFFYRPNSAFPAGLPIKTPVEYDVYAKYGYDDSRGKDAEYSMLFEGVTTSKWYRNIPKDRHISELKLVVKANEPVPSDWYDQSIKLIPAGMFGQLARFYFTVEGDYVGRVENKIENVVIMDGWSKEGHLIVDWGTPEYPWDKNMSEYFGPHSANIVPVEGGETRVVKVSTKFSKKNNNIVSPGKNRVVATFESDATSLKNIDAPFYGYVLLPTGVTLDDNQSNPTSAVLTKINDNYKGSGRQLVKIEWKETELRPKGYIQAGLDVTVADDGPNDLNIDFSMFLGSKDFTVPTITGDGLITDTYRKVDENDLNENKDTSEFIVTTGNHYIANKNNSLYAEILAKGDMDAKYLKSAKSTAGSKVNYKLQLKNTTDEKISKMVLIDTLPSIGDKDITVNEARNSEYALMLTGPLKLPTAWSNKAEVKYSTVANPKKVGTLDKNTVYSQNSAHLEDSDDAEIANWKSEAEVDNWEDIKSFKIESNEDIDWIQGRNAEITFDLKMPDKKSGVNEKSIAYTSFAVAGNHSQAIEPNDVGVELTVKSDPPPTPTPKKKSVILASGEKYTDVLTATVLGNEKDCPILLTKKDVVDEKTINEIKRLGVSEVIISGGEDSVSNKVVQQLKDYNVRRIAGINRYETAVKIGNEVRSLSGNLNEAMLVDGTNFPDVITISTLASQKRVPILITKPDKLVDFTKDTLKDWSINSTIIGGSYNSVSKNVENSLGVSSIKRIGGVDRYKTAELIGTEVRNLTGNNSDMILVDGTDYPDGITINSVAAKTKSPILLTTPDKLTKITEDKILEWSVKNILIGGGYNSVSKDIEDKLQVSKKERVAGKDRYETAVKISQKLSLVLSKNK